MKNARLYIPIVVVVLCVFLWSLHAQKRTGPTTQSWEYKTILRYREFHGTRADDFNPEYYHAVASVWSRCIEDEKVTTCVSMSEKLAQLGNQGWELLSVTARSSELNDDYEGATDEDLWVFKRPKE